MLVAKIPMESVGTNDDHMRQQKREEVRKRIKMMKNARRGKTLVSDTQKNMTKQDRRKMKKVVKSSQVDDLLKSFNIQDSNTKKCLQKGIQDGKISTMNDLATFISHRTNKQISAADLMTTGQNPLGPPQSNQTLSPNSTDYEQNNVSNWIKQSEQDARDFMQGGKYEDFSIPDEKRRPVMKPPSMSVSPEDLV